MTRDEAIGILLQNKCCIREGWAAEDSINAFVALGMLKLDEPKNEAEEKFKEVYRKWPLGWTGSACLDDLKANGLKIVEK